MSGKTAEDLADAYYKAEAAYAAYLTTHGHDESAELKFLHQNHADLVAEIIRAPAASLLGILAKLKAAVSMEGNLPLNVTPEAAIADALGNDEHHKLDDRVALQTIWADVARLVAKGGAA